MYNKCSDRSIGSETWNYNTNGDMILPNIKQVLTHSLICKLYFLANLFSRKNCTSAYKEKIIKYMFIFISYLKWQ